MSLNLLKNCGSMCFVLGLGKVTVISREMVAFVVVCACVWLAGWLMLPTVNRQAVLNVTMSLLRDESCLARGCRSPLSTVQFT